MYINGKFLSQAVTGVQRYALEILNALDLLLAGGDWILSEPLVLVVPAVRGHNNRLPSYNHIQIREVSSAHLHLWEQLYLPWVTRGSVLLNLSGSAPLLKFGQICTFHDTAVFDVPKAYSFAFTCWYRLLFLAQARLSSRLLTVSEFSKQRIVHHLGVSSSKVGVVYGAADHMAQQEGDSNVLEKLGVVSGDYFLVVGSANPTKNFSRLMTAFSGLESPNARLVVVGGSNAAVFASNEVAVQNDSRIIRAGRLSDAELKALYVHARVYIFPSIYEGFGLPPIEAMLSGCPVIAAQAASIPEICGRAAEYFDPLSIESMQSLMIRALHDDVWLETLRNVGREHVKQFNWHHSAANLLFELSKLGIVKKI